MKQIILWVLLLLMPTLALSANLSDSALPTNTRGYLFEIHGSNTIGAELAPSLIMRWMQEHEYSDIRVIPTTTENEKEVVGTSPNGQRVKVFVAAHGSSTGFKQAEANQANLAAASRPAKNKENDLFPNSNLWNFEHETVVAIDGLAVILNPNLPIDELTVTQVGELFSGKISNWKELGGPDLAVTIHARDGRSGTYDTFNSLVLKRGYQLSPKSLRYESNSMLADAVAREPGSIGFTAFATVNNAKAVRIKDGTAEAMLPTASSIATEDYPLSRRLYLYQPSNNNPYVVAFLNFAKSASGQEVVSEAGFVSQNLQLLTMPTSDNMPTGYRYMVEKSKRITTNFRFKNDSNELDNKALDDIARISELMAQPENADKKIILVGFSNKQKDEFKARLISESRVLKVKHALVEVSIIADAITGYGEINPVASNSDMKYALRNQRVEVWLR